MVQLEILQRCMEYCSAAGSQFCLWTLEFVWVGGVVASDALLSLSPSLIWLQLGFGLAGAVTI